MENLLFLGLIAIAAFLRWIAQRAEKAREESEQEEASPPAPTKETGTNEEQIRRFLEALGQPTSTKPPPKVPRRPIQKRTNTPQRRPIFSPLQPLPPLTTVPPPLPSERPPPVVVEIEPRRVVEPKLPQPAVLEVREVAAPAISEVVSFPETALASTVYPELPSLLKSPRGLRDAIILREIFGPPRSLQKIESPAWS